MPIREDTFGRLGRPGACLVLLLQAGCVTTPPAPAGDDRPPPEPVAPAEAAAPELETILSLEEARAVENLLREAEQALADNRLTTPSDDNALDRLLHVLVIAPGEPRARAGLDEIGRRYQRWAETAAENGEEAEAMARLDLAAQVRPDHPALAASREAVRRALASPAERVTLDPAALDARDAALGKRLARLGTRAKEEALFVIITAPQDAWSRWIYQQMNAAPPARRLRARSEIGPRATVVLRAIGG